MLYPATHGKRRWTDWGRLMLSIRFSRVHDDQVDRLRAWMAELNQRRDEVLVTLEQEGVHREEAYLLRAVESWVLVYVIDADDPEHARAIARASTLPIDQQHIEVMSAVIAGPAAVEQLLGISR